MKEKVLSAILTTFENIASVPRCSGKEDQIRAWLIEWAKAHGHPAEKDSVGNVKIDIGSKGSTGGTGVVLQAHQDMVCEKVETSSHDFSRDPISMKRSGEWLGAEGTTLGADNGAGIAIALGIVEAGLEKHPPLELLFTANEEAGMSGARGLAASFIRGRRMINLDSEDEGVFTIGCAGNRGVEASLPIRRQAEAPFPGKIVRLKVGGLHGGHSATDIARNLGNANVVLARLVRFLVDRAGASLIEFDGGQALNAIAREASALLEVSDAEWSHYCDLVRAASDRFRGELEKTDPDLQIVSDREPNARRNAGPLDRVSALKACELVLALPHGVHRLFENPALGTVETSANLAATKLDSTAFRVRLSVRSAERSHGDELEKKIGAIAVLAGGTVASLGGYEPWRTREDSYLVRRIPEIYQKRFGVAPRLEISQGGLECGIICGTISDLDVISVGPTIEAAHSPSERLHIPSLERVGNLLISFLAAEA